MTIFFLEDDNMERISTKCKMTWILDGRKKDWMICMEKVSLSSTLCEKIYSTSNLKAIFNEFNRCDNYCSLSVWLDISTL